MSWSTSVLRKAQEMGVFLDKDEIERVEQYYNDEITYDNPEFPEPEKFLREILEDRWQSS
jgi:hypothetical protein